MARVLTVRAHAALMGSCLLGGLIGCATGSMPQDAAVPQLDAEVQGDAATAADAPLADAAGDAAAQQDALTDAALLQDALRDTAVQQDAQHDTGLASCTNDDMCNPDGGVGGRFCFINKGVCYTPGNCANTAECPNGASCNLTIVPPGFFCTCNVLTFPPILCRAEEQCVPVVNVCQPL